MNAESAAPAPDFSGVWGRTSVDYEPPPSGAGPVMNKTRTFYMRMGDDTNPILKPEAAEKVRRAAAISRTGVNFPTPSNQCTPWSAPYAWRALLMQMVQQKDQVTIVYVGDQQIRHVRLNQPHPARVTPSYMGDSIGHYEGDTLVIDTVGFKVGRLSMIDNYGTPFSPGLHLVERIRLIDRAAADKAAEQAERDSGKVTWRWAGQASIQTIRRACRSNSRSKTRPSSPGPGRARSPIAARRARGRNASVPTASTISSPEKTFRCPRRTNRISDPPMMPRS